MNVLGIIPARGGSKGLPRKNLKLLAGKPLIAWSIEAALESDSVNRLVVSTDDDEIAYVAEQFGAEVIRRPSELAGDKASSEPALLHTLDLLMEGEEYEPELVVFLQATSPCRSANDIESALSLLVQGGYDSVFSACAEHFTGRWRLDVDGCAHPLNFDPANRPRRQDYPFEYLENGSIYVFKPRILRETGSRMGGRVGIYTMPVERSFQIDSAEDLDFLDKLMIKAVDTIQTAQPLQPRIPPVGTLRRIELLALDFDGVLTDNRVWVNDEGHETVCCSRSDSWRLNRLKQAGIQVAVVSTESSQVVEARCRKLGIPCVTNVQDKAVALSQLAASMSIERSSVAFVGNDINDRDALCWAGIPVLVGDADSSLAPFAVWVLRGRGGQGAVRECCEMLIKARETAEQVEYEGEGVYFFRRSQGQPPDYEEAYWGEIQDPDGKRRDRLKEREQYLGDMAAERTFLKGLRGGKILDVGCGPGFLLSALDGRWDCYGVEVSKLAAEQAGAHGRIFRGKLEDAAYPDEYFDAVVFHHVIEHLEHPQHTLRQIRRILRPGGWLVLGTPDFDSGCARLFGERYRLLYDRSHVSLFSCESMFRLLRDECFVIEKVDYPYFSTRHFSEENLLRLLDRQGTSPPFYGNFMTFYARKPDDGEPLRPPQVKIDIGKTTF